MYIKYIHVTYICVIMIFVSFSYGEEGESISHSVMSTSATPWTIACQVLLSMEFSRQEYWSGLPFPSPGNLPDPEIEPRSPALQEDSLQSEPPGEPMEKK